MAALDFAASRSRTDLYCSRHRRKIRLALRPLATPKLLDFVYGFGARRFGTGMCLCRICRERNPAAYWFVLLAPLRRNLPCSRGARNAQISPEIVKARLLFAVSRKNLPCTRRAWVQGCTHAGRAARPATAKNIL